MRLQILQFYKGLTLVKENVNGLFQRSPRVANALTGFLTFSAGDLLVQRYELTTKNIEKINYSRSLQLGALGVVMNGYFLVSWYRLLDKFIGHSMRCYSTVSFKVIADQVVFAPFSIAAFFGVSTIVRFNDSTERVNYFNYKMKDNFWSTFIADCSVWPVANVVNFKFITLVYRPAFTAIVQLLWQAYLSAVADQKHLDPHPKKMTIKAPEIVIPSNTMST